MVSTRRKVTAPKGAKPGNAGRAGREGSTPVAASTPVKPSTVVAAGAGVALAVRPPLEKALEAFTRELRAALDRNAAESTALRAELKALRSELDSLRQRHEAHTHSYTQPQSGGGGHQWIELRHLQGYIDGEHAGYKQYGFWSRAKSTPDTPPEQPTSGPSV